MSITQNSPARRSRLLLCLFGRSSGSPERAPRRGSWGATALERPEPEGRGKGQAVLERVDRSRERLIRGLFGTPSVDGISFTVHPLWTVTATTTTLCSSIAAARPTP